MQCATWCSYEFGSLHRGCSIPSQVPTLETPQGGVWESNAIARYLARLADKGLFGKTAIDAVRFPCRPDNSHSICTVILLILIALLQICRHTSSSGLTFLLQRSMHLCAPGCILLFTPATFHMTKRYASEVCVNRVAYEIMKTLSCLTNGTQVNT